MKTNQRIYRILEISEGGKLKNRRECQYKKVEKFVQKMKRKKKNGNQKSNGA